jgi:polyphosphate kinase
MLIRHDPDGVTRRYAHLGTGNYNPNTARFYTDLSLLTADPEITASVHSVFNYLTAHSESDDYAPLLVAPLTLAESTIRMIHREAEHAAAGRPAHIIAKMNSLLEQAVIEALYAASRAGVQIDLIVRGICSLRPGIPGVSDNIRVRSVVGRFLEHSRIFYFANGGEDEIYCGSADWMPRNLFERCEVVFPIRDAQIRNRIRNEILGAYLADTAKSRIETAAGDYPRVRAPEGKCFNAQDFLIRVAEGRDSVDGIPEPAWKPELVAPTPEAVKKSAAPPKRRRRKPAVEEPQAEPTETVDTGFSP